MLLVGKVHHRTFAYESCTRRWGTVFYTCDTTWAEGDRNRERKRADGGFWHIHALITPFRFHLDNSVFHLTIAQPIMHKTMSILEEQSDPVVTEATCMEYE